MQVVFVPPTSGRFAEKIVFDAFAHELKRRAIFPVSPMLIPPEDLQTQSFAEDARFLLGFSPVLHDVRFVRSLEGKILARGALSSGIRRILWNSDLPGGLPVRAIEKENGRMDGFLPFDPSTLARCENQESYLEAAGAHTKISRAIKKVAQETAKWLEEPLIDTTLSADRHDWHAVEKAVTAKIWQRFSHSNDLAGGTTERVLSCIDEILHGHVRDHGVPSDCESFLLGLRQRVFDHVTGLGPLEQLMRDPSVNEVMVNGVDEVFVERESSVSRSEIRFDSETQLRTIMDRVAARAGRRIDLASPLCDVRLSDGSRVNLVLPPVSIGGPLLTMRRFRPIFQTLDDLIRAGTVERSQADQLVDAVRARDNIIVAGNAGAGKTTLLNILASFIAPEERILTLEDAAELQIGRPHVVRMETRQKNAEGIGEITMSNLLINALRMRPDRLIIGECRGAEAIPMLQAMNTGHDGSMTTLHANSAGDALKRLESMVLLHAPEWSSEVVREQISAGIDLVIHIRRRGSERKVVEIRHA